MYGFPASFPPRGRVVHLSLVDTILPCVIELDLFLNVLSALLEYILRDYFSHGD